MSKNAAIGNNVRNGYYRKENSDSRNMKETSWSNYWRLYGSCPKRSDNL